MTVSVQPPREDGMRAVSFGDGMREASFYDGKRAASFGVGVCAACFGDGMGHVTSIFKGKTSIIEICLRL